MRSAVSILLVACLGTGCASRSVNRLGLTTEYTTPIGAVVWTNGNVSIVEQTVHRSESTRKEHILSEKHYLMTPEDIGQFDVTPTTQQVEIGHKYTEYPVASTNPTAVHAHEILANAATSQKHEDYSAYPALGYVPYVIDDVKVGLAFASDPSDVIRRCSRAGNILQTILIIPAFAVDVVLIPVYLMFEMTQL